MHAYSKFLRVCMYVCVFVRFYAYLYVYLYIYVRIYTYTCAFMHICALISMLECKGGEGLGGV